ncbi:10064_t:CDS:2 [Dentiscutata erythropus]|uniref:10064_t:CDS:1 n=1 Tax=Dentiscutata erythropus TaxID=1348616 RepID=A0A9N8ZQ92_9GLOM|nr:10064_t:CDS:2 [Dentiscutata erythropus]
MPRQRGEFWNGFTKIIKDEQERYECKKCNKSWVKNESRMLQHYNLCFLNKIEESSTSISNTQVNKITQDEQEELASLLVRGIYSSSVSFNIVENDDIKAFFKKASILRWLQIEKYRHFILLVSTVSTRWGLAFYCLDYLLQTKNAIRSILVEDNIEINYNIKLLIMDDQFWQDLKILHDFLEPFVCLINELEGDSPLLSVAFFKLRQLEISICNNTCVSNTIIVENSNKWDSIIESELMHLAGLENQIQVLEEFAKYVGKINELKQKGYLIGNDSILESNKLELIDDDNINLELDEIELMEENNLDLDSFLYKYGLSDINE